MVCENYYLKDYMAGYITINDIPYKYWTDELVKYALKKDPYSYYEKLLEYTHLNLTKMNVSECLKIIPEEYKTLRLYKKLLDLDFTKYNHLVPLEILDKIKLSENIQNDLVNGFKYLPEELRTPALYKQLSRISFDDYLMYIIDYHDVPDVYRTKEMCLSLFYENLDENIKLIPDEYKSIELCEMLLNRDFKKYFSYVPEDCRTVKMYEKYVSINPINNISNVPKNKRSQKMYDMFFNEGLDSYFDYIPIEFRTKEMYHKLIKIDAGKYYSITPKSFIDEEIALYLVKNNIRYLDLIPEDIKNGNFYLKLIKIDPIKYLKYLPVSYYKNSEIINNITSLLIVKNYKNKLNINKDFNKLIIDNNPNLTQQFTVVAQHEFIVDKLIYIIKTNGNIKDFIVKYHISNKMFSNILSGLEKSNQILYNNICNYINRDVHGLGCDSLIKENIKRLETIILSLGRVTRRTLTSNDKLAIAYLTDKYLDYSLEELYAYNNSQRNNNVSKIVNVFIEYVLDYTLYADTYRGTLDVKKISYNNEWLKDFKLDKFFDIRNGEVYSKHLYGPNEVELTVDTAKSIITRLAYEEIPLNLLIVSIAFRKYFQGELDNYIKELHEFDKIFEEPKRKKR